MKSSIDNHRQEPQSGLTADLEGKIAKPAAIGDRKFLLYTRLYSSFQVGETKSREGHSKMEEKSGVDEARTRDLLRDRQAL